MWVTIKFYGKNFTHEVKFSDINPYAKCYTELMMFAFHPLAHFNYWESYGCISSLYVDFDISKDDTDHIYEAWNNLKIWKKFDETRYQIRNDNYSQIY